MSEWVRVSEWGKGGGGGEDVTISGEGGFSVRGGQFFRGG